LLISLPDQDVSDFLAALATKEIQGLKIGEMTSEGKGEITVY